MQSRTLNTYKKTRLKLALKLLCIFLIMIFVFSIFYYIFGKYNPTEKEGIYLDDIAANYPESLYFSIVTITTLGYGDFTPLGASRVAAVIEALAGLFFAGYSISQILSVKQDASMEYLLKSQIIQLYTTHLDNIKDAKESLSDSHRTNTRNNLGDINKFNLYYGSPLYTSVIALQKINGYTKHIVHIGMIDQVEEYINRAATNIEELSSTIRKYVNFIDATNKNWKTTQSKRVLKEITQNLETFLLYIKYSKFDKVNYKDHVKYSVVLKKTIQDIRNVND